MFGTSTYLLKKEKPVNQLPPSSFINVSTFYIGRDFFTGINSVPKDTSVVTTNFEKKNTPIDFRNYLAYSFDQHLDSMKFIDNEFWIDKINTYGGFLYMNKKLNFTQPNEFWADAIIPMEKKHFSTYIYFTPSWSVQLNGFSGAHIKPNFDLTIGVNPWFGFFAKTYYHYSNTLYYSVPETLRNYFIGGGIAFNTKLTPSSHFQFYFDFGPGYANSLNTTFHQSYGDDIRRFHSASFTTDLGFRIFLLKNLGINISGSTTYMNEADVQINFGIVGKIPLKK